MTTATRRLLNTKEAAAYLGRQPATLRWYRSRGVGPRYTGRNTGVRYAIEDLDAWLAEQT